MATNKKKEMTKEESQIVSYDRRRRNRNGSEENANSGFFADFKELASPEMAEFILKYFGSEQEEQVSIIFMKLYALVYKFYKDNGIQVSSKKIVSIVEKMIKNSNYRGAIFSNLDMLKQIKDISGTIHLPVPS
jgi:hypothetical protein